MTLAIEAPTDAQLGYIASLCREHGMPHPVVYSKQEASEIIGAMRGGTYDPERYRLDADLWTPTFPRRCGDERGGALANAVLLLRGDLLRPADDPRDVQAMSHEWNCTCVRCERERDWLDAVDVEPEPREPTPLLEVRDAD